MSIFFLSTKLINSKSYPSILNKFTEIINSKKKTEIILHSLNSCILFYKKYGFFEINKNNFLEKYEGYENEEKREDFILLKYICK